MSDSQASKDEFEEGLVCDLPFKSIKGIMKAALSSETGNVCKAP